MTAAPSTTGKTTLTLLSDQEIVVTRVFDAPRRLVFDAWTKPEHIPNWLLGPDGWTMPICEVDLRPGGAWRYVWRGPDGEEMLTGGEFREIDPPERVVFTEQWGGEGEPALNTLLITEKDGRTTAACTISYPSKEVRDMVLATGMVDGWSTSYDRLDSLLSEMA